jgi:hypothetical protein
MSAFGESQAKKSKSYDDEDDDVPETSSDIEEETKEVADEQPSSNPARIELQPSDFYFGATLGEGAFARVVHAKSKKNSTEFAVKIMEKMHIKRENKVGHVLPTLFLIPLLLFYQQVKHVLMERKVLTMVSHPFIIK